MFDDYRARDVAKDTAKGGGLLLIVGIVVVVVALAITVVATAGFGIWSQRSANFRGETDKRNKVEANGSYRIATYDHFFDLCASVQNDETMIANTQRDIKLAKKDPDRLLQLQANLTAQQNARATDIHQYNVDAGKQYTEAQFLASNLPSKLDINVKETTCTAP